jgi:hypothetical protein
MLAGLVVYVSVLALLAIFGLHLWDQLPFGAVEPPVRADWSVATRSYPTRFTHLFGVSSRAAWP